MKKYIIPQIDIYTANFKDLITSSGDLVYQDSEGYGDVIVWR